MTFYKLEEALKVTSKDPLKGVLIKRQLLKNPLSGILPFTDADRRIYSWIAKEGVGGSGKREINGAFHEGSGSKHETKIVELDIYNETREIDRLIQDYDGDLLQNGIFEEELVDASDSVNFAEVYDYFNAAKANGGKYDGMFAMALAAGQVYTINDSGIATPLDQNNIYDEFARLQDETEGDDVDGAFLMSRKAFTKVTKYLRLSGFEVTVATDNFGRPYARFRNSLLIPCGSYTVNPQEGQKVKLELIPTVTFEGTANTERIVYATFGAKNVHGLRGNKHPKIITNIKDLGPKEHPTIDVEDVMALVDKSGFSVSVLEGVILS